MQKESRYNIIASLQTSREESKKEGNKTINNMLVSTHLSITILNVNRLNSPIKRHRVDKQVEK